MVKKTLRRHKEWSSAERALFSQTTMRAICTHRAAFARGHHTAAARATFAQDEHDFSDLPPALRYSVPDELYRVLQDAIGDAAPAFLAACDRPGPVYLRVNAPCTIDAPFAATILPSCIRLLERTNIRGLAAWQNGAVEVQDLGSQAIVHRAQVQAGQRVLDYCCGRGGKSLALYSEMKGEGELYCYDIDQAALRDFSARRGRASHGYRNLTASSSRPSGLFDVVVVDAPCSRLGTLRRSPHLRLHFDASSVDRGCVLQREILREAKTFVRPGGRILYATCTLTREENEDMVREELADFTLLSAEYFTPQEHDSDGFYVASARKVTVSESLS